jgi:hypothetical protein
MPWTKTGELDVYDDQDKRFTLNLFVLTDESGAIIAKEYRTASGLPAKQVSETEFQYPGAKKFRLQTMRPIK